MGGSSAECIQLPHGFPQLVIVTGNPGVSQGYPYPYLRLPVPVTTGKGFHQTWGSTDIYILYYEILIIYCNIWIRGDREGQRFCKCSKTRWSFSAVFRTSKRPCLSALVHIFTLKNGQVLTETCSAPPPATCDTNYPNARKHGGRPPGLPSVELLDQHELVVCPNLKPVRSAFKEVPPLF